MTEKGKILICVLLISILFVTIQYTDGIKESKNSAKMRIQNSIIQIIELRRRKLKSGGRTSISPNGSPPDIDLGYRRRPRRSASSLDEEIPEGCIKEMSQIKKLISDSKTTQMKQ